MPANVLALQILLILLPGFAAAYIVQRLASRAAQTDLDKVIEALLFSFAIYGACVLITHGNLPFSIDLTGKEPDVRWDTSKLIWLLVLTLGFALGMTAYINRDGTRIFRWSGLTERTSRSSIWNDVFSSEAKDDQIVQVELDGGRSVQGVLRYYSDAAEDCSLYLIQARWVSPAGEKIEIPGPGILLTRSAGIRSISFLDPAPDDAPEDEAPSRAGGDSDSGAAAE